MGGKECSRCHATVSIEFGLEWSDGDICHQCAYAKVAELEAQLDRSRQQLWRNREFIVQNIDTGKEFDAVIEIDNCLTNTQGNGEDGPLERAGRLEVEVQALQAQLRQEREARRKAEDEALKWRKEFHRATGGPRYGIHSDEPY